MMFAELKDKSQVTIPKAVVRQLGLKRGDMFDVVVHDGVVVMVPVVVYPKAKAEELEALAYRALTNHFRGADERLIGEKMSDLMYDRSAGEGRDRW